MIPQSELDRIEKEADDFAFQVPYDGTKDFYDKSKLAGYIAGASSEYLRSASRMEELEEVLRVAQELVKQYDGCHLSINEYQDVCFKMEEMNLFESALEKLEAAISSICRPQP